jgi:hypothetical protein
MSAAELLLRLGCSLTAWLVLFAHAMWLAVLGAVGCSSDGAQPWLALLWWTPLTLLFAALLPVGLTVPGIAGALRVPALALLPLLAYAAHTPLLLLDPVTLGGQPLCGATAAWTGVWAPAQLLVVIALAAVVVALWRRAGRRIVPIQSR